MPEVEVYELIRTDGILRDLTERIVCMRRKSSGDTGRARISRNAAAIARAFSCAIFGEREPSSSISAASSVIRRITVLERDALTAYIDIWSPLYVPSERHFRKVARADDEPLLHVKDP